MARRRPGASVFRNRRPPIGARRAGRFRVAGICVGTRGSAGACRPLRSLVARHAVSGGRNGLGATDPACRRSRPTASRRFAWRCFLREHGDAWQTLRFADRNEADGIEAHLTDTARQVLQFLRTKGASFAHEIVRGCALDEPAARIAVASLAVAGLVVSDGFAGVRAVTRTLRHRPQSPDRRQNPIGRWSATNVEVSDTHRESAIETQAKALLARYGIVFRRLLAHETNAATWRSLTAVYRRLEARGEIRGGRFVSGMSGEQFALPEAVERMREIRRSGRDGRLISISAVDPLNLTGILTSDERVRSLTSSRLVYRDGVVQAAMEGDYVRPLTEIEPSAAAGIATALDRRHQCRDGDPGRPVIQNWNSEFRIRHSESGTRAQREHAYHASSYESVCCGGSP